MTLFTRRSGWAREAWRRAKCTAHQPAEAVKIEPTIQKDARRTMNRPRDSVGITSACAPRAGVKVGPERGRAGPAQLQQAAGGEAVRGAAR